MRNVPTDEQENSVLIMCGVAGIVSESMPSEEIRSRLRVMCCIQRHRGPDDERITIMGDPFRAGLGFSRLSILDLETGMQPISAVDGTLIACNGQVYNYIELKPQVSDQEFVSRGDIEVALHLYRRFGSGFVEMLNGMYAGAIYDPVLRKVLLFRDRFGIKPLYYAVDGDSFVFSSEVRPILEGYGFRAEITRSLLPVYFTYRYVPGEQTMFRGIRCLPPGSILELDPESLDFRITRYWDYSPGTDVIDRSAEDAADEFTEIWRDAVRIRLRSDVEVGTLLSGGMDSSAVTSETALHKPDVKMFTIAFEESRYNELPAVKRFISANSARLSGASHFSGICLRNSLKELPDMVRALEEPISLGTLLPTDQVCALASEHVKVVMTGEGADEIFAGYRKFLLETAAMEYRSMDESGRANLVRRYPELKPYLAVRDPDPVRRYVQSEELFSREELGILLGIRPDHLLYPPDAIPALRADMNPIDSYIAMECQSRLPNYVLLRLDKLSMRHSLETRTPFLDYRLAEFAAGLPPALKVDLAQDREKYVCRLGFSRHSILDSETAFRAKQPFTIPVADWLASPSSLPENLQEVLLGNMMESQGILNGAYVRSLIDRVSVESTGPDTLVSGADRVLSALIFTLWFREFF
jgi:asparagine synthase (glutamine-hydrolysing)